MCVLHNIDICFQTLVDVLPNLLEMVSTDCHIYIFDSLEMGVLNAKHPVYPSCGFAAILLN